MDFIHKNLASGRWQKMTLAEQMGNIGSEITRMRVAQEKNDEEKFLLAGERVLELIDLTIMDERRMSQLKEILRLREILADVIINNSKEYNIGIRDLEKYCLPFAIMARR